MKRMELKDCLRVQLAAYPHLSVTDELVEAWFRIFKNMSLSSFEDALANACKNSKTGFPPVPSDVQLALSDANHGSTSTANVRRQVFADVERGMDKVVTTIEKLGARGKIETETRVHYRANQSHVAKALKENFDKDIFMEEYTTSAGVRAYKWTRYPNKANRIRLDCVDGVDIPIYAR